MEEMMDRLSDTRQESGSTPQLSLEDQPAPAAACVTAPADARAGMTETAPVESGSPCSGCSPGLPTAAATVPIVTLPPTGARERPATQVLSQSSPHAGMRKPPESVVKLLSALQGIDAAAVELSLVATQLAYKRGEQETIEGALLDQYAVLNALTLKWMRVAGESNMLPLAVTFANLGLRSMELARKTLSTLNTLKQTTREKS